MRRNIYTLSDYGAKTAKQLADENYTLPQGFNETEVKFLTAVFKNGFLGADETDSETANRLIKKEIIVERSIGNGKTDPHLISGIRKRYFSSPVIHVHALMIEYTTQCNLNCPRSCFKAFLPRMTETRIEDLKNAVDAAKEMGVAHYLFNGGEVSKFGRGWLSLAKHISKTGHHVGLITNGWWGIEGDIETSDGVYHGVEEYMSILKDAGVKNVIFSVDGLREEHDIFRNESGLYEKILRAVESCQTNGIQMGVSILLHEGIKDKRRFFEEVARIFELKIDPGALLHKKEHLLDTGVLLEEIDGIGSGIRYYRDKGDAPFSLDRPEELNDYCLGITRGIKISIRANGEVEPCTAGIMGKGFGNINQEKLPSIINKMREGVVYRLFDENRFAEYAKFVDRDIFGDKFHTRCSMLAIISSIAHLVERYKSAGRLDKKGIRELNLSAAKQMGFLDISWSG